MLRDQQIPADIKKGDSEAFGKLYDEYIKKIYNFIYYKTHHKETAEDLTSATFVKALQNIQKYSLEKGSFSAWLYKIARNTVIDHYRTMKFNYNIEDAWDISSDEKIDFDTDSRLKIEEIKKYIKDFKQTERDIIIMRVWQEMSYREIAEILGKTENNCKVIFSRAIKNLKEKMPLALFISFIFNL